MNRILLLMAIICLFLFSCFAQSSKSKKQTLRKPVLSVSKEEKLERVAERMEIEASYYAPIRYVIVYNWIFNKQERRIDVLMEETQFNEENLIAIFGLIKKRFPRPSRLMIDVHTSLATIETPEEEEMAKSSKDRRFGDKKHKHKKAFYLLYGDGNEVFYYTTSLSPNYEEKRVTLQGAVQK